MTNNRDKGDDCNYKHADEALAKKWGCNANQVTKWRKDNKYTWHELNDTKTMQLVPTVINKTFKHMGGSSESQYCKK